MSQSASPRLPARCRARLGWFTIGHPLLRRLYRLPPGNATPGGRQISSRWHPPRRATPTLNRRETAADNRAAGPLVRRSGARGAPRMGDLGSRCRCHASIWLGGPFWGSCWRAAPRRCCTGWRTSTRHRPAPRQSRRAGPRSTRCLRANPLTTARSAPLRITCRPASLRSQPAWGRRHAKRCVSTHRRTSFPRPNGDLLPPALRPWVSDRRA